MKSDYAQQQNLDQEIHDKKMEGRDLTQLAKNLKVNRPGFRVSPLG